MTPSNNGRFWWVNQNQTYKQEIAGGYLWSPKRKSNGTRNPFYEFMREVAPGDTVFSFKDTLIKAIGIASDYCFEAPKPDEFGAAGPNWNRVGWKVPIKWNPVLSTVRPSEYMERLGPLLPKKYSPLLANGNGLQAVYLTAVPYNLAMELGRIIGPPLELLIKDQIMNDSTIPLPGQSRAEINSWEDHLEREIRVARDISDTERKQTVKARRGQGLFRDNVFKMEKRCRVTGVDRGEHLVASHCKPWRDCETADERLDGENGLMLTPTIDHLFDRGFISFEGTGRLLVSPIANTAALEKMGVRTSDVVNVGQFSEGQKDYLDYHLEQVFLKAVVSA
ncbi:MAG: HNH endonuclease signature motif containing protein [Granulosicoccaceae bacterium]